MLNRIALLPVLLVATLAPATALGQDRLAARSEPTPVGESSVTDEGALLYEKGGLLGLGIVPALKLGGSFSGAFTELGTSPVIELELGYLLPVLDRSIEGFIAAVYAQPTTERFDVVDTSGPDGSSRLDAPMSYELTQQEFTITVGGLYRFALPVPLFRPYAAVGGRLYMMKTKVTGSSATESFGENREGAVSPGFYAALGGELHFGPGAVLLEAQITYAKIDGFVMRDTNAGAINLALGYRLFL